MHKATNCIISCIDFRFQKKVIGWLNENNYIGNSDFIFIAGSSRDLVKPTEKAHFEAAVRELTISIKLHNPDNIYIIDHQDCGGYASDNTIPAGLDYADDKNKHIEYAKMAIDILNKLFLGKVIKIFYASFEKDTLEELELN